MDPSHINPNQVGHFEKAGESTIQFFSFTSSLNDISYPPDGPATPSSFGKINSLPLNFDLFKRSHH